MNGGPLFVQTDGLRQFSQTHTEIAAGVSQLLGGAPTVAGVETSHGQIAFAVQNALSDLLGARQGTLQTTAKSGDKIAELLGKAAAAYDKGDERSAGKLKATMEGAGDPSGGGGGGGGASPASGASGASGATGAIGQVLGQLGQLGQMGQQGSGAMQGLTQGLQQIPQQVMQGVQQIVEAATGAGGPEGPGPEGSAPGEPNAGPGIVPDDRLPDDGAPTPEPEPNAGPGIVPPAALTRPQQV
ncbi:ESX-1 secretion-associated protein [Mycolicibacterium baixiangningiae]|uniref:ESX-1 secretion-associated protein n=1 Tax=Mycolicibacterium baixiangningiae TaxID=2761578 RepID=UPI001D022013|nr:ESX-1 secretion-associated protein [Mycolicibacterium baixiangningiae]